MRPRGILAGTTAVLAIMLLAGCSTGSPDAVAPTPVESASVDPGAASPDAAQLLPEEQRWTQEQKPLGDAADALQSSHPEEFAYAYFENDPVRLVVGFRGAAPAEARPALESTGLGFVIEEDVGVNYAEVHQVADSVAARLFAEVDVAASVGAAPEQGPRVIRVTAFTPDDAAAEELAAGAARLDLPEGYSIVLSREYEEISAL